MHHPGFLPVDSQAQISSHGTVPVQWRSQACHGWDKEDCIVCIFQVFDPVVAHLYTRQDILTVIHQLVNWNIEELGHHYAALSHSHFDFESDGVLSFSPDTAGSTCMQHF